MNRDDRGWSAGFFVGHFWCDYKTDFLFAADPRHAALFAPMQAYTIA